MYAEFDDTLVTGNEIIDSQHRELIGKINDLLRSCEDHADRKGAVRMLNYLADYTEFHFAAEEKLQEEASYPEIEAHKAQHAAFVKAIKELEEMLEEEEGPTDEFVEAVNKNVVEWLKNHIQICDKKVAAFVRK